MLPIDLRDAIRRWRRRPGLALAATLVLALGIGATTAMYSIVDAVLLRQEPWPAGDALVRIYGVEPPLRTNPAYRTTWNKAGINLAAWRGLQQTSAFSQVGVWRSTEQVLGNERTELVSGIYASSNLLPLFGVQPALGRLFIEDDDGSDTSTIILSHDVWQRQLGGDPDVIGRTIRLTQPGAAEAGTHGYRTIIGVLPEDFTFPDATPDVLLPLGVHAHNLSFGNSFLRAVGRLAPGMSLSAAAAAAEPLVRGDKPREERTARLITLRDDRIGIGAQPLWVMLIGAAILLLVACSNVAGLLLGEARRRHRETAVRFALGGTRLRVLRQLVVEHALLAVLAGGSGVLLAIWLVPLLIALAPAGLAGAAAVAIDGRIAAWSVASAFVATILAGLIPAAALASTPPGDALKHGGREATPGGRWRHRAVVSAQFALALVLMVAAGLLGETVIRLGARPLGFTPEGAIVANVVRDRDPRPRDITPEERAELLEMRRTNLAALSLWTRQRTWVPIQSLVDRLSTLPGVTSAAVARTAPFVAGLEAGANVRPEGRPVDEAQLVRRSWVSTRYFEAIGASLLNGRTFVDADRLTVPSPVVISRSLERQVFGENAVGRVIEGTQLRWTVVGVVADVRQRGFADDELAMMYEPLKDVTMVKHLIVRASGDAGAASPMIREAIEGHEAPMFVTSIAAMDDLVTETIAVERSRALLSSAYGLVALVLASVGLFGLAARLVAERRREIGIRVALGAGRRDVRRLVMADAWIITAIGLLVGIPSAIAMSRLAEGLLYGVAPAAPHVLGVAALGLTLAALVATAIPAIRATRIDPSAMFRDE